MSISSDQSTCTNGRCCSYEYEYDRAGNLTKDSGKGLAIEYNHLNLPSKIETSEGTILVWYSAGGVKLQQQFVSADKDETRVYHEGSEFVNGQWEATYHAEGRNARNPYYKPYADVPGNEDEIPDGAQEWPYRYEYTAKDHLGNGRLYYSDIDNDGQLEPYDDTTTPDWEEAEFLQENHTYAFGLQLHGPWIQPEPIYNGGTPANQENRYGYNGKELVEGGLERGGRFGF